MTTDYSQLTQYTRHGGAYDRGSADRYYGRRPSPHYYTGGTGTSDIVFMTDMTPDEIDAYYQGYENETDRKIWD